jgi:predicted small secreted protein
VQPVVSIDEDRLARLMRKAGARRAGAVPRMPFNRFIFVEESDMRKLVALMMVLAMGVLAGCNTMEGLGKDVQRGGEKVEGAADRNR